MVRPHWMFCVGLLLFYCSSVLSLLDETSYSDLTCTGADIRDAGVDPSSLDVTTGPDNNLAFSYICENFKYMFKCCGKVKEWKLKAGKTGTIQLQVWRRTNTAVYQLIGENYCQITATGSVTSCPIDEFDRILVRKGDFIGWHNQGNETLLYKEETDTTDSTLENLFRRINNGDLYPGDTYDWSNVEAYNDRLYAIQAIYEESQHPTITADNMIVPDYISSGDTIGRILYQDADNLDNGSLVVVSTQTSPYYSTHIASGYVSASNIFRPRDDELGYFVYDLCYKTASASHSITVQETALVIDNLDATFTVSEAVTTSTLLHTITVTDPVDEWFCYAGWTPDIPFLLKAETTTSYGFYLVEHGGLNYDSVSHYSTLPVTCVENKVTSTATVTANIQVYVTENQPPTITNLDASVGVDAETAFIGDLVYQVTATDPESDIVTFSMTCTSGGSTNTDTFRILSNGDVVLKKFLTLSSNHQFDCDVTATDSDGNADGPNNLQIYITNIDNPVSIIIMPPDRVQIMENMPVGTSLYKFEYSDVDTGSLDTKSWTMSFSDNFLSRFFSIDTSTGVLSLAYSEINAEDIEQPIGVDSHYTLAITVADVKSSATKDLLIQIINENEPPWFTEDYYTIDAVEGPDETEITDGSLFTFNDEDLLDAANTYEDHFYSLDCDNVTNTQRFFINKDSGAIKYQGDYDLDTDGTPSDVECVITIEDKYGLSDTAGLYIHIQNDNEFSPEFTHVTYNFFLASNTLVGTYLTTVSAVDYDSSDDDDNKITYTLNHAAVGSDILAVNYNGVLYLADSLETHIGTTLTIDLLASNYGVGSRTGTSTITIEIPATTTTSTTTTDRNKDFYEDQWSYYWLLATLFGATLIVVAITMVIYRICRLTRVQPFCYQCCMQGICCRDPPPPLRGFGDRGYDLASFGHRHVYTDEDAEVDGWLVGKRDRSRTKSNSDHRYGTPNAGYDSSSDARPGPIYEMFKVPSRTGTVPKAANYLDPYTSTRKVPRTERKPLMGRP